ncbi:hypothetical protein D9613_009128 [Agrocybe pediades]|uniref:Gpi1-domain-containing protein n=1 Tax=Agrocybe pediades TaxID=84607 RepID=A0A8H4R4Z5_9AGAR|nr:hypothetical protein D9613_009128 [Agrocybe pediades]
MNVPSITTPLTFPFDRLCSSPPPTLTSSSSSLSAMLSVFWPDSSPTQGDYICYGWLHPAICVAAFLPVASRSAAITSHLSLSSTWQAVKPSCSGDPIPLGVCSISSTPLPAKLELWHLQTQPSFSYILYTPHTPKSLRFYALSSHHPKQDEKSTEDHYSLLSQHDFTHPSPQHLPQPQSGALNQVVVNQMNAASLLQCLLSSSAPPTTPPLLPTTATFLLSLASSLSSLSSLLLSLYALGAKIAGMPLYYEVGTGKKKEKRKVRLKDLSATVQQLDVRISQSIFFINNVASLQRQDTADVQAYAERYTNFFNTSWLILNDMTLGIAMGSFINENKEFLAAVIEHFIRTYLFTYPRAVLLWLDAWPAGLKLNAELSGFYVRLLSGVLDSWGTHPPPPPHPPPAPPPHPIHPVLHGRAHPPPVPPLRSARPPTNPPPPRELRADEVRKRKNALRGRTDAYGYDMDQLLFGTVMFTLIAFLVPTAGVYYVFFAVIRLITLLVQAALETLLALLHHFPLFAIMLRVKDRGRLSGGVYFVVHPPPTTSRRASGRKLKGDTLTLKRGEEGVGASVQGHMSLESQPISVAEIFVQYIELTKRLSSHYNPLRLLWLVVRGERVASIGRYEIRYEDAGAGFGVKGGGGGGGGGKDKVE